MDPNQVPAPTPTPAPEAPVSQPVTPTPAPIAPTPTGGENPGKTLGIASLIVSLLGVGLVGLILGVLGLKKSKAVGQKNGFALAGIIIGALNILVSIIVIIAISTAAMQLASKCAELGAGSHTEGGVTYKCPAN